MAPPRIRRVSLSDFRSYEALDLKLSGRPVVLTGANGAGKTNLLEALSMLSAGRGMRHARLADLARQNGAGGWTVLVEQRTDDDPTRLGVGITALQPDKRLVRIDGVTANGPAALLDYIRFLWLTPAQDRLFMEGASERRRFLDRMTLAHDPAHGASAAAYEKAMRQRTKLLEQGWQADETLLGVLESQMAEAAVAIAAARREMVTRLALGTELLGNDVFPASELALEGTLEEALADAPSAAVEEEYEARLMARRRIDGEAGRALEGPHRSDLLVAHKDKQQAARLCSTGEQKALLIGLVLANARALEARGRDGDVPLVLLLDEVAAHLDEHRRAALFDILDDIGFQVFMTGTDRTLFDPWGDRAEFFTVADGQVRA